MAALPRRVPAVLKGKALGDADENEVDYIFDSPDAFLGSHASSIPMTSNVAAPRAFYGSRFLNQAQAPEARELPWVLRARTDKPDSSFDEEYGAAAGALFADDDGEVEKVDKDGIHLKLGDGTKKKVELAVDLPMNRKSALSHFAAVKPGDVVKKGQLLADSTFTKNGAMALGVNAKIASVPYRAWTMDDATVISESFAKKLATNHTYGYSQDYDDNVKMGRDHFASLFPKKFTRDQLAKLDENGHVRPGVVLEKGDPIFLATKPRPISSKTNIGGLKRGVRELRGDASQVWDSDSPGRVTDSLFNKGTARTFIHTVKPAAVGDKLALRPGQKMTISKILPDDRMLRSRDGQAFDLLLNPLSMPSRVNTQTEYALTLGKIAQKLGVPYRLPGFNPHGEDMRDFVQAEADKHGVPVEEEVFDPEDGVMLENPVHTGSDYVLRLHHISADKNSARGVGAFDANEQPSRGGGEAAQAKRLSGLETASLLSSGAYGVLREGSTVRGQRCFTADTDVLTRRGWVPWGQVLPCDELLTRSKEDATASWYERPLALVDKPFDGELYGYEGKHLDWLVTPDHNFWGVRGAVSRKKAWRKHQVLDARSLFEKDGSLDAYGAAYAGTLPLEHVLHFDKASMSSSSRRVMKEVSMTIVDYCRFIGWWCSEGSAGVDKEGRGYISISQSKDANPAEFAEIHTLLKRVGLGDGVFSKSSDKVGTNSVVQTCRPKGSITGIRVRSRPLAEHLLTLGNRAWLKRLPALVFEAPLEARRELLRCYTAGDGCVRKNGKSEHWYISSCSEGMIQDLQRLALISGFSAHVGMCEGVTYKRPHYRLIIGENLTEASFVKRPASQYAGHYKVPYAGRVYCATMSTGLLYVRRNGKSMWSGNCDAFWRNLRSGTAVPEPGTPFVWHKFRALLAGAGLRTKDMGKGRLRLGAFTDKDLDAENPVELKNGDTIDFHSLAPVKGGLFDPVMAESRKWGYISLPHAVVNPAFEDPVKRLLGLTDKQYRDVMAGRLKLSDARRNSRGA